MKFETLQQAVNYVNEHIDEGLRCPCCDRFVKRYTYSFNSSMAKLIIFIYKQYKLGNKVIHVEKALHENGIKSEQVQSKLVHWGMIEPIRKENQTTRMSGYYKITERGMAFATNSCLVPKKMTYYNNKVYEESTEMTDIQQALGKGFNYYEMMGDSINN